MVGGLNQLGRERALAMFADWTDRIAAGEPPPRPYFLPSMRLTFVPQTGQGLP